MSEPQALEDQAANLIVLVRGLGVSLEASNAQIAQSNRRIAESNKRIGELGRSDKRNRHLITALAISLIFDLVLSIVLGITAVDANTASDRATKASAAASAASAQNANNAIALCHSANDSRAAAMTIWDHVLDLVKPTNPDSAKVIADVRSLVAKTYAPKHCAG